MRPLTSHSSTCFGASIEQAFAASRNGSLMMFTVKFFVARMFAAVSLNFVPMFVIETETSGG